MVLPADKFEWADTIGKNSVEKAFIESLIQVSKTPADQLIGSLLDKFVTFGLKLVAAIIVYVLGGLVIKWLRKVIRKGFERRNTDGSIVSFVTSLVTAVSWTVVVIIAIGLLGIETTSIAALLATGGMAIGMALSGTVQNFAGGIMILAFKPFKVGDYIEAQGYTGKVVEMNIISTKITTNDNKTVVLPNGTLSNQAIKNIYNEKYRRVDINIGVEYGCDADQVISLLLDIAYTDSRVVSTRDGAPEDPFVGILNLGPSSVDFTFRVWVMNLDYWNVYFDMNRIIYMRLPENGINFPYPQLSVHLDKK